jgi:hypothetical protein
MSLTNFAGRYNANNFAYGITRESGALQIGIGAVPSGAQTITLQLGQTETVSGKTFAPPNTNAPILIGSGSNQETVTPSAVSNPTPGTYNTCQITATFANAHGTGDLIMSGTVGLQEALNYCGGIGGGTVVIDPSWTLNGGTQAMVNAAVIPTGVVIEDLRAGNDDVTRYVSTSIANAQVLTLNSVGVALVPAAGAGTLLEVISCVLENVYKTAAYANGGVISIGYGLNGTAASSTVAATFLTSPTANQSVLLTGAVASSLSSAVLNKPLTLQAATADFITGAGSLNVRLSYRVHTSL